MLSNGEEKRIVILTDGDYSDFSVSGVLLVPLAVDLAAERSCQGGSGGAQVPEIAGPCPGPLERVQARPTGLVVDESGVVVGQTWRVIR